MPTEGNDERHEVEGQLREHRARLYRTRARLLVWPTIICAVALSLMAIPTGVSFARKLFGGLMVAMLGFGMWAAVSANSARVVRQRKLGGQVDRLEERASEIAAEYEADEARQQAGQGLTLSEPEGEGGALSLKVAEPGALSAPGGAAGAGPSAGSSQLSRRDRNAIRWAGLSDSIRLFGALVAVFATIVGAVAIFEWDYILVAALLFGVTFLLPPLVPLTSRFFVLSRGRARGSWQPPDANARPTVRAETDDRVLVATRREGRWFVNVRVRSD